jgi:1-acyl-sn-glycerol-3-phosphate acyltransferase
VREADRGDLNGWWRFGIALVDPVVSVLFRLRIRGSEHVPPGAAILASNHVSGLDGVLLAVATARTTRRMTRFLVAAEFFQKRRFGWALRLYQQIPLRRGTGDAAALQTATDTVASGALAGIFPEGRVNAKPEEGLQRGHRGAARVALAAAAPLVPVGIWGTQARWPHRGFRWGPPLRPVVSIVYGSPIIVRGSVGSMDDVERATAELMAAIDDRAREARETSASPPRRS